MEKQEETKKYIAEKNINQLFEDMMVDLLRKKPDDPVQHLIKHLKNVEESSKKADTPDTVENLKSDSDNNHQPIIFVLGGPGSGKGTQCGCIVRDFGYTHFSAGDLLREEIKSGSERGQEIQEAMKQGRLVPSEWTIGLLKNAMEESPDAKGYLIDGFPRNTEQGPKFEEKVRPCDLVLMFECSEKVMMERILKRADTSGRVDDNVETLKKRFANFTSETLPVTDYYQSLGKLAKVNSERSVEDVHADISQILKERKLT